MDIVKELNNASSIPDAFFKMAATLPDNLVYSQAVFSPNSDNITAEKRPRDYICRSFKEVSLRIKKISAYLTSIDLQPGERVAIISNSRSEWMEADLGVMAAGGSTVSVYQSLLAHDIAYSIHEKIKDYPAPIKVNVVRETRASALAKPTK